MTEEDSGAERRADDARRAALTFATLCFAALPRVPADMAPVFQALHQWLDGRKGIGDLVTGMSRPGYGVLATSPRPALDVDRLRATLGGYGAGVRGFLEGTSRSAGKCSGSCWTARCSCWSPWWWVVCADTRSAA